MRRLRLTQSLVSPHRFRVEAALEGDRLPRQTATVEFGFNITPQDREDIRWYLEDYLQHVADPVPKIAARIEGRIAEMGADLFKGLFQGNDDARDLWTTLRDHLSDTRVEIITGVLDATALPWELLRDPKTDTPVALRANAFVRAAHQVAQRPNLPQSTPGPIRILLVICRPGGSDDVPFRSVASRLIKGLSKSAREAFQFDVLRPPTFEQLGQVLGAAKKASEPYHVVHFDGHGAYVDLYSDDPSQWPTRKRGYVAFENPAFQGNEELVHGTLLGRLLAETEVPILVLNACRSAHAEAPSAPARAPTAIEQAGSPPTPRHSTSNSEATTQRRAFGSLAQEVVDAGVAGVVAMRYNVYVVTAAQFVADLYGALAGGQSLGGAVSLGRKQLEAQPLREIAYQARPLHDWMVPVVHESVPITLFTRPEKKAKLKISISADAATPSTTKLGPGLAEPPDIGFFGRDETLLALDRGFDTHNIVLLHAYAGSGKTTTATEFARWYSFTGGVKGPVLFTSFEQFKLLPRVLDQIGQVFQSSLEGAGVNWLALTDERRREVALQVLNQIPVLWIWDNVEPVAGFPAGTQSLWSAQGQLDLANFLSDAQATKAKFLLTSRRDERGWLGDLTARVMLPDMWMPERVQLARALAQKYGRPLIDIDNWRPLLEFTQGNPMTITVLVSQALRDGLRTRIQIDAFVEKLRAGEAAFDDEEGEGRSKSMGASLNYGFDHAFNEDQRKQLALLHLFQGFVDVDVLREMGAPEAEWRLPEVLGLTRDAGINLLDRAAEIGLLTANGDGYYSIHPAVPFFLNSLFDEHYSSLSESDPQFVRQRQAPPNSQLRAAYAFVESTSRFGNYYANQYETGNRDMITHLAAEESNLLHALRLAYKYGWWLSVISVMQGLRFLYRDTGRQAEWALLVNESVPYFIDPKTEGSLPNREEEWSFIIEYRAELAEGARQWVEAEHLRSILVERNRQRARPAFALLPKQRDATHRHAILRLASSLYGLGALQRTLGLSACAKSYEESLALAEQIGDQTGLANCAFSLGSVHLEIPDLRDLARAEDLYKRSLKLRDERDRQGRALCLHSLGRVATERFLEARLAKKPKEQLRRHLNAALRYSKQALETFPPHALPNLAAIHQQLGNIYLYIQPVNINRVIYHYREAIRYTEMQGDKYSAGLTRYSLAYVLMRAGRLADAEDYAHAALRDLETLSDRPPEPIQRIQRLIEEIEQVVQSQGG